MKHHRVIIIGSGPAGIAAAIQLKRCGHNPLMLEKNRIGGLLANANLVENYPGFPGGIPGPDLIALFEEQLKSFGIEPIKEEVVSLDYSDNLFRLYTEQNEYQSDIAVIASGTSPKKPPEMYLSNDISDRIFYEIVALRNKTDRQIVIVGAGDAAFDYALTLSAKNRVTILNRGDKPQCLPLLFEKVAHKEAIDYRANISVESIKRLTGTGVLLKCFDAGKNSIEIEADYIIPAFGREPALQYLTDNIKNSLSDLQNKGLLYTIGDVNGTIYRQTSIAVGEAVLAAMKIDRKLKGQPL